MGLFEGKKGLILGVANDHSIAWAIAKYVMDEGGVCGFTHLPDRADDERQRNRRRVALLTDPCPIGQVSAPAGRDQRRANTRGDGPGEAEFGTDRFPAACDRVCLDRRSEARHDRDQPRRLLDGDGDQRI